MTTAERINKTLQQLPNSIQQEVLDFAEFLFQKTKESPNGAERSTGLQKAESIERWAAGHRFEGAKMEDEDFESDMAAFAEASDQARYKGTYSREDVYFDHD